MLPHTSTGRWQVLHAGERVGADSVKYCIRTDVMYRRDPPQCTEPNDLLAFELYQQVRAAPWRGRVAAPTAITAAPGQPGPTISRHSASTIWAQARELDAAGRAMEALPKFMRAAKLSKGIARAYRIGGW